MSRIGVTHAGSLIRPSGLLSFLPAIGAVGGHGADELSPGGAASAYWLANEYHKTDGELA
jgi:hypothetical protein